MGKENLAQFLKGFSAAYQLLVRASQNGSFVEFVCLATSIVDALLRQALFLHYQLRNNSMVFPDELFSQEDDDKAILEREIYKQAFQEALITPGLFAVLEDLYKKRNKVIHRFIISKITTRQVLDIALEYERIIPLLGDVVRKLEDEHIKLSTGVVVTLKDTPLSSKLNVRVHIDRMADEKHGDSSLAEKLRSNDGTNGR
jgi:hypothetical protein